MDFTIQKLEEKNITLVYETLDLARISLDKLKALGQKHNSRAQLIELPDNSLVVAFTDIQTALKLGDKKLRIDDQSAATIEGTILPELALDATKAIRAHSLRQIAYGFNFRAIITLSNNQEARKLFRDRLLKNSNRWEERTGSKLNGFAPRFFFSREEVSPIFQLAPAGEGQESMNVAMVVANVHFETNAKPSLDKLQTGLIGEYTFLMETIRSI